MQSLCVRKLSWLVAIPAALAAPAAWCQTPPSPTKPPQEKSAQTAPADGEKAAGKSKSAHAEVAYLGIDVESLHPSLASHLPAALAHGQGILVNDVEPNSPAAKAGLKEHDVLVSYDDQKLFAPEQLAKLVRTDTPERAVTLGVVRGGQSQQVKVTLGARPYEPGFRQDAYSPGAYSPGGWEPAPWDNWSWRFPEQPAFRLPQSTAGDADWEAFDSLTLRKTGDNKFKVEIQYLDKAGKVQRHAFEGSRDEIRRDIDAEKDLPASERQHLLSGLGLSSSGADRAAGFPGRGFGPWGRY